MNFYDIGVIVINVISIVLILLTLKLQFKLKNKYNNNGYVNHRYAFILGNIGLLISIITRVYMFFIYKDYIIYAINMFSYIFVFIMNVALLLVCVIQFYWFKGSDFEIFNFIKRK